MKVVRDTAADAPLYARMLRLRYICPGALLCFALFEGTIIVAGLLSLAELTSWWAVVVLPLTVAGMVKVNDVAAGAFAASFTPALAMAGVGVAPGRRGAGNVGSGRLHDPTRPFRGAGSGAFTAGVRGLLAGRPSPRRGNQAANRASAAGWPRRHPALSEETVSADQAGQLDRPTSPSQAAPFDEAAPFDQTVPLNQTVPFDGAGPVDRCAAADHTEPLRPAAWLTEVTDQSRFGPPEQRSAPGERAPDEDPALPQPRRGRHAADAGDDQPVTGRHGLDDGAGTVYGTIRPTDHDETPAVGWRRRLRDEHQAQQQDGSSAELPDDQDDDQDDQSDQVAQSDSAQPLPSARSGGSVNGRSTRSVHDDDLATRYRGGLNQGRFT